MGFTPGDSVGPNLTEEQRRHLLGQCIDVNLLSWLIRTVAPSPPLLLTPPNPPHRHPLLVQGGVIMA